MKKAIEEGYRIIRVYQVNVYSKGEKWLEQKLLPAIQSNEQIQYLADSDIYNTHIQQYASN